jgi:hypothetical protein
MTIGELVNAGGLPVIILLLVYPFGVFKLMEIVGEWLYPMEFSNDNSVNK